MAQLFCKYEICFLLWLWVQEAAGISLSKANTHSHVYEWIASDQLNSTCDTVCRCRWFDPLSLHLSDPLRALELQPYSLKPLLRRAMAYESLERYRKAYVDYKTVLQLDTGVQAAHDSVHR